MRTLNRWILCLPMSLLVLSPVLAQTPDAVKSEARDTLNRGVRAYRESNTRQAIDLFTRALEIDPEFRAAELYLGVALASSFKAGNPSAENQEFARKGVETFERIVRREPGNAEALSNLGNLYTSMQNLSKARETYLQLTRQATQDAKPFYSVASINWLLVRNKANPPSEAETARLIAEGLEHADIAIALNPSYQEAMTYKNLLLREQAARTTDPATRDRLTREADSWFQKALDALKDRSRTQPGVAVGAPPPPPPPTPPPPPFQQPTGAQVIGSEVAQANLVNQVKPVYPPLARAARVQGSVLLQVTIDKQGAIANLGVVSGHALLVEAAVEAVRQWQYRPILLNGQPIEVVTTVTVNFVFQ